MKYLEDEKLTELTSELTDAVVEGRVINGRIEVFTMKRAGTDKKYAQALGEKYVADLEMHENSLAEYQNFLHKNGKLHKLLEERNTGEQKGSAPKPPRTTVKSNSRKRSQSVGSDASDLLSTTKSKSQRTTRARSVSFDRHNGTSLSSHFDSAPTDAVFPRSALGDFQEISTRRLMTDLILTLNASFPDYDFGNVRPAYFRKQTSTDAIQNINNCLSELATKKGEVFLRELWIAVDNVVSLSETEVFSYVPPTVDEDPMGFLTETLLDDDDNTANSAPLWTFNYFFVNKSLKRILFFSCVETMRNETRDLHGDAEEFVSVQKYRTSEVDFDLDPAADVAGGIPVATSNY